MGDSPDVPTVADPKVVSKEQQDLNRQTSVENQAMSMVNQSTPYGSLSYEQTGTGPNGVPIYTAKTKLAPEQQVLLDLLNKSKTTAGGQAGDFLTNANYGANPSDVIGTSSNGMVKSVMDNFRGYYDPFFSQDVEKLDTKLKNQGFAPGEPGYDRAMNSLKQSQGQTITGGMAQIEPLAWQQATAQYKLPAELAASLGAYGAPGQPTFQQTPQANAQPANLIGATANAQQAQMEAYKEQMKNQSGMMQGMFGIPTAILGGYAGSAGGSAAITSALSMMSDRRVKQDIKKVGKLDNGLSVYSYRYIWGGPTLIGLMADEVEEIHPDAVDLSGDLKMVNYELAVR